ncbi:PA2779 family protein [Spartinivicinus poritis]|uniref:PA2779 family protein n=1 Tax=Spartinivicinus poritis TaxID=2994640 RepID=A0ABT5UDQ0_9GAMM|nr:PA2779 family protein [Spartinivicinus sp. A2-2]MDE1464493.1 PA2779 family protein [Spartinivicinus sp. A2-2]
MALTFGGRRLVALILTCCIALLSIQTTMVRAGMVGTDQVIAEEQHQVDKEALLSMLEEDEVKEKLQALGVPEEQVKSRIDAMTPEELAQFNEKLTELPAGSGVAGVIVLFLVVFIVTDMLCATDIFTFVRCIN